MNLTHSTKSPAGMKGIAQAAQTGPEPGAFRSTTVLVQLRRGICGIEMPAECANAKVRFAKHLFRSQNPWQSRWSRRKLPN
ncbi:hypothetical protein MPL3356_250010 [Mesorhizobium plurifarium]|uniref:Uncharacterized protein n=1 Tax=Mesorhizobium plurifarium TaxID=69974 RepID=A0A090DTE5_MESPL|nr:hypothetical protein MPL3356_250010 [Mesorhizobium plurifarium]